MPISRKRKNHREKVLQYRERVASEKKKAQEVLMKLYQDQMQQQKLKEQVNGVDVENTDIDIDLGGMEITSVEEPIIDITNTVVEEPIIDITDTVVEEPIVEEIVVEKSIIEKPVKKTSKKSSTNKK